jgi:RecA-family ATPase
MYAIDPLFFQNEPSAMYGFGGSGKSRLALTFGVAAATGTTVAERLVPGGAVLKRPVLYLDWEATAFAWRRRLDAICEALAVPFEQVGRMLMYRRLGGALHTSAAEVRRMVRGEGFGCVMVDSLRPAAGVQGDGEAADSMVRLFEALHSFEVTTLLIGHPPKQTRDNAQDRPRIYGSVFAENYCRSIVYVEEVARSADHREQHLRLVQTKANDASGEVECGLTFAFTGDGPDRAPERHSTLRPQPNPAYGAPQTGHGVCVGADCGGPRATPLGPPGRHTRQAGQVL